ncbi:MAG TPA: phosphoribosylformylglycinamidine cyclo-ligase [Gemmatimonadota bacterium]|jgi:phosphoribosylformylglycinamidine cyclo-ligase|nr:phosphoribosylformylglycinamidine cyclo-ligase [Gemmatimonadota bacterium]
MPEREGPASAYRAAGVDIEAADRFKKKLAAIVGRTPSEGVVGGLGGFGGCFTLADVREPDPVLVASADGVGTKVLVARAAGRHDTVGRDLVNHCVDDLLAQGARPLFFLDYLASGRLDEGVALALVEGFAAGCRENGIPLLGGETAEMPDVYEADGYDLAGFIVGVAPRARLDRLGAAVVPGDVVLGLPSSGLHTNGYTLARKVALGGGRGIADPVPWGAGTWADVLLAVHRSYLPVVLPLLDDFALHGCAHVTGGGFEGNLPRPLPPGVGVRLCRGSWDPPPLFEFLAREGNIAPAEMVRVFNMGIGFCLYVDPREAGRVARACSDAGAPAVEIGEVVKGEGVEWV